jgi:hypothetical protein
LTYLIGVIKRYGQRHEKRVSSKFEELRRCRARRANYVGHLNGQIAVKTSITSKMTGGDQLGSVVKKRRKKMRKHKHRKLLARTRHQRRKGK